VSVQLNVTVSDVTHTGETSVIEGVGGVVSIVSVSVLDVFCLPDASIALVFIVCAPPNNVDVVNVYDTNLL